MAHHDVTSLSPSSKGSLLVVSLPGKYSLCVFRSLHIVFSLPVNLCFSGLLGKLSLHKTEEDTRHVGVRALRTIAWFFCCTFPFWFENHVFQIEATLSVWVLEWEGMRSKPIANL